MWLSKNFPNRAPRLSTPKYARKPARRSPQSLSTYPMTHTSDSRGEQIDCLCTAALINALASSAIAGLTIADRDAVTSAILAREKSLELDTRYEPVPGDPRVYYAAGFAQVMCSAGGPWPAPVVMEPPRRS